MFKIKQTWLNFVLVLLQFSPQEPMTGSCYGLLWHCSLQSHCWFLAHISPLNIEFPDGHWSAAAHNILEGTLPKMSECICHCLTSTLRLTANRKPAWGQNQGLLSNAPLKHHPTKRFGKNMVKVKTLPKSQAPFLGDVQIKHPKRGVTHQKNHCKWDKVKTGDISLPPNWPKIDTCHLHLPYNWVPT